MTKKIRQFRGKIRRYVLVHFKRGYIEAQQERRYGECNQCGNCCEILFKCPFLIRDSDGLALCSIYEDRPGQCAAFPIDEKCLADVDFDCTYSFAQGVISIEAAAKPLFDSQEPAEIAERHTTTRHLFTILLHRLVQRLR